jgi:hypothetical protein
MTRGVQGGAIRAAAVDVCLVALARGPLIRLIVVLLIITVIPLALEAII